MKRIFLDTNFILDLLARGPEYSIIAKKVLDKGFSAVRHCNFKSV